MKTKSAATLLAIGIYIFAYGASAQAQTYDLLDQSYGTSPGDVAFNASFNYAFGTSAPSETLSANQSSLAVGTASHYAVLSPSVPAFTANSDATIDFTLDLQQGAYMAIFLSQNQAPASSQWNNVLLLNAEFSSSGISYADNAIADYNARVDGGDSAPSGFDSSVSHEYRISYDAATGISSLYLDGSSTALLTLDNGAGAAGDGFRVELGLYGTSPDSSIDVANFRAADSIVPEPATLSLVMLAGACLLIVRLRKMGVRS